MNTRTPLMENSDEYRRVLYLLKLGTRDFEVSEVCIWNMGVPRLAGNFEKFTHGLLSMPSWVNTTDLGENNSLESVHENGFTFSHSMRVSTGTLSIDLNQGMAHRFILCQTAVGRSFVIDDASDMEKVPDGYDSLYHASAAAMGIDNYQHEYSVFSSSQILPMYLVQFFVDPERRGLESNFGFVNPDPLLPMEKIYDRYDFFDPILYKPVSIRDKMTGSHSSGEYSQHQLIPIVDAFDIALSDSLKPDPKLLNRKGEINSQLQAIDEKLRLIRDNSSKVEEQIYAVLQEALFKLQDLTQEKLNKLLSEEVELRRQQQEIDWIETYLEDQRDKASQLEFLSNWKCHKQLRADISRPRLATNQILESITSNIRFHGSIHVEEESFGERAALKNNGHARHENPLIQQHEVPTKREYRREATMAPPSPPSPPPQNPNLVPGIRESPLSDSKTLVGRMNSYESAVSNADTVDTDVHKSFDDVDDRETSDLDSETFKEASLEVQHQFTSISPNTPAKYASFSLVAESRRRLKQLNINETTAADFAKECFRDSKLLGDTKPKDSNIASNAEAILFSLPWSSQRVPTLKLLYATWDSDTPRSVAGIISRLPSVRTTDSKMDHVPPFRALFVMKANNYVFGAYVDESWRTDGVPFGSSNSFLFSSSLDIKIPYHGRKSFPLTTETEDESIGVHCAVKSSDTEIQFGTRDLVLRGSLAACSSDLEYSFGIGLRPGSDEAASLLAGSSAFVVDELELWHVQ